MPNSHIQLSGRDDRGINEKMATKLKIICAWCGKDMGEKDGRGQTGVTSSMCEQCWERYRPGVPYPKEENKVKE